MRKVFQNKRQLVFAGLFSAFICVATVFLRIPINFGFSGAIYNLGDCVILLCGFLFNPIISFCAASIGSALADVIAGGMIYVPATFVIKGLMGLLIALICSKNKEFISCALAALACEAIMIVGYFVYELILFGAEIALLGVVGNVIQGVLSCIFGVALIMLVSKNKSISKFLEKLK